MWWNDYIGLPFKWNGKDRRGISCWGLVVLVQNEVFGHKLPHFDEWAVKAGEVAVPDQWLPHGREIDLSEVHSGDVLHMRGGQGDMHCGVVTKRGYVLHIEKGAGSHIRDYVGDPQFKNRVIGAYRVA